MESEFIRRDQRSVPRTSATIADPVPSTTSNYASPSDPPFQNFWSVHNTRPQSPTGQLPQPFARETTPLSPAASVTGSGRRSTHSSSRDSMDPSYYGHGHGYMPSSSGTGEGPSRSYVDSTGPEAPVKLTPVTGRVSRAKKGVPVHVCEMCQKVRKRVATLQR
jgi:hypothetical protein